MLPLTHGETVAGLIRGHFAEVEAGRKQAARARLDVEGIRRVAYRTAEGAGRLLVKAASPPLGPAARAAASRPRLCAGRG